MVYVPDCLFVFSHLGFWSGNLFLIAPFPDLCLLVPLCVTFWRECLFDDDRTNVPTGNGNKLRTYRTFKTSYSLENYLLSSSNSKTEIHTFAKIRISSHK